MRMWTCCCSITRWRLKELAYEAQKRISVNTRAAFVNCID